MKIKASNKSEKKNFAEKPNSNKNDFICKDGFCLMQTHNESPITKKQDDKNFFEPI